jgi:hypothetical protein
VHSFDCAESVSGQFATKVIASAAIAKIFFKRVSLPRPIEPDEANARLFGEGLAGSTRRSEKFSEPTPVVKDDQKAQLRLMLLLGKSSLAQPAPAQDHKAPDSITTRAVRKLIDMRAMPIRGFRLSPEDRSRQLTSA